MLYRYDPTTDTLDALLPVDPAAAKVLEKQIEQAVARNPACVFRASTLGSPILVVTTSAPGKKMPDVVGLDAEGRLVLVECKRGWADRQALAQLLDYAADYAADPYTRLSQDWLAGEGKGESATLLERFRAFAEDADVAQGALGSEQVLVVIAAGHDTGFTRIADYLRTRGVQVHFVPVALYKRSGGELYFELSPIDLTPAVAGESVATNGERAWMINTDETHCADAWPRFVERRVAAIWGYPDGPATLEKGAQPGDIIYAYLNGRGVVGQGRVLDGQVRRAEPGQAVFREGDEAGNEWHLPVEWTPLPGGGAVSNAEVRKRAGAGLPVRNTFCRLWNPKVREVLEAKWSNA